jgi:hypothetical protein
MAGTWNPLQNQPPAGFDAESMLLLTDGSIFVHHAYGSDWRRLVPDAHGEYTTGTWSAPLTMQNTRQYFASGTLRNGNVFAIGGEDSNAGPDTPLGEIFDTRANTWSPLAKPATFDWIHGDISSCVLPDGKVLLGCIDDSRNAIWNPHDDSWRESGTAFGTENQTKSGRTNEETWTLLRDGTVVTVEVFNPPAAEKYLPHKDVWVSAAATPRSLIDTVMEEIGPAILLTDGRVFAIGGSTRTALYTPPHHAEDPGNWVNGPDLEDANGNALAAIDAPAVLLPNGKVLCCAGNRHAEGTQFWSGKPALFLEFDPISNGLVQTPTQPGTNGGDTWEARLMLLPNGQVLYTSQQNAVWIYSPDGAPHHDWRPRITEHPRTLIRDNEYELEGHRFNGLSHAVSYGDDYTAPTNYPLVRLAHGNTVTYCRTHGFSTFAVATGNREVRTRFHVPPNAPLGDGTISVVANGIASQPAHVHVK